MTTNSATPTTGPADPAATTTDAFFDAKYAGAFDPWGFASDAYELGRYRTVLDHVDPARHRHVFEPGCSIGVLTELLGRRCETVDATDLSATAVERASARCAPLPGVSIRVGGLVPSASRDYDLIVFSEVGYYLERPALDATVSALSERVRSGGRFLAVHWIGRSSDHVLHGAQVHRRLASAFGSWRHVVTAVHLDASHDGFVLDAWDRP